MKRPAGNYLARKKPHPLAMDRERQLAKGDLLEALKVPRLYFGQLRLLAACQLCGRPFVDGHTPDLHELLLTRRDVQGCALDVQQHALHDRENLMLLCNDPCNIRLAVDRLIRHWLTVQQIRRYDQPHLVGWIHRLQLADPTPYLMRLVDANTTAHMPAALTELEALVRERLQAYGQPALF